MVKYCSILPAPSLKEIIRSYWVLDSSTPYIHHSMADMCPELLFHYDGRFTELFKNGNQESSFTAGLHAQSNIIRKFQINNSFGMFGVYFYPHAIPLIFNVPAYELTNQMPELDALLPKSDKTLEEQVAAAPDTTHRIRVIEQFVYKQLAKRFEQLPVFNAIREVVHSNGLISIETLSSSYFLSERQFERQFKQHAGFSPKIFARIARFHKAMKLYGTDYHSLTEIALECGYYDQSHFIHDFREFSGYHPKAFFSGNTDATAWME